MNVNPYEPPKAKLLAAFPNVELLRTDLAAAIHSFLASEITAFQLDERVDSFRGSGDPVIEHVVEAIWHFYDDCTDHYVCLSKPEWDYIQRLLLVLNTDCQVESRTQRHWSSKQLLAALTLMVLLACGLQAGWDYSVFLLCILGGAVSIALSFWPNRLSSLDPYGPIIRPFASFADLAVAYRSSSFRKTPFPKEIAGRRIRSPLMNGLAFVHTYCVWLVLSPIPLLFQALPAVHSELRVRSLACGSRGEPY